MTGSIADSINFAVDEMRGLVRQINTASVEVANGAELAVQNARFLSDSNMQQASDISQAAEKMEDSRYRCDKCRITPETWPEWPESLRR